VGRLLAGKFLVVDNTWLKRLAKEKPIILTHLETITMESIYRQVLWSGPVTSPGEFKRVVEDLTHKFAVVDILFNVKFGFTECSPPQTATTEDLTS